MSMVAPRFADSREYRHGFLPLASGRVCLPAAAAAACCAARHEGRLRLFMHSLTIVVLSERPAGEASDRQDVSSSVFLRQSESNILFSSHLSPLLSLFILLSWLSLCLVTLCGLFQFFH